MRPERGGRQSGKKGLEADLVGLVRRWTGWYTEAGTNTTPQSSQFQVPTANPGRLPTPSGASHHLRVGFATLSRKSPQGEQLRIRPILGHSYLAGRKHCKAAEVPFQSLCWPLARAHIIHTPLEGSSVMAKRFVRPCHPNDDLATDVFGRRLV